MKEGEVTLDSYYSALNGEVYCVHNHKGQMICCDSRKHCIDICNERGLIIVNNSEPTKYVYRVRYRIYRPGATTTHPFDTMTKTRYFSTRGKANTYIQNLSEKIKKLNKDLTYTEVELDMED